MNLEISKALQLLNNRDGLELRLVGRYSTGETGAYRVLDAGGLYYALKFTSAEKATKAIATTETLRQVGYPAATYEKCALLTDDIWYALIRELPGQPALTVTAELVEQLLELVERQANRALFPLEKPSVVDTLLHGANGYALHATMRAYSKDTSELLDAVVEVGRRFERLEYPTNDVVHGDLNPANILVLEGQVTGIVDWEGTGSGDRAFDLATMLYYTDADGDAEETLWQALLSLRGSQRACVYLAHMILRQVEWSARHHESSTVQRHIGRSRRLFNRLHGLI